MTSWPQSYACYLRVYEPLAAFKREEREQWRDRVASAAPHADQLLAEGRRSLTGLLSMPPRPVPEEEPPEAFVLYLDAGPLVCPVQSRLRSWVAFGAFRSGLPDELLHAFVPPAAVARVDAEQELWADDAAGSPLRILTATWGVPLHWFAGFAAGDRVVDSDRSLVYRARISAARRRVARALRTLRRSLGELDYADDLDGLARWLEEFHARSWIELDYGGLTRLVGGRGLVDDTSVDDVAAALDALAAGDQAAAAAAHDRLVERWGRVQALEHAN